MKLSIQHNIPDSIAKDITISFAKLFAKADYAGLRNLLSNDVYIVIYNRERKHGINSVLDYFEEWQNRTGDIFECEVRWSAQFSQPEIYFTSEEFKQAYILGIENSKIARILLTPRSFSKVGFSIDEVPYNIGFIDANAPKKRAPLSNHYFCPICGKNSEHLEWRKGIIFKDGSEWGKKTGLMINASVCKDCHVVCEVSPNINERLCLAMTREQQMKADASMTKQELARYVDNTMGNRRPLTKNVLKSRTNELSKFGQSFHEHLDKVVNRATPKRVLNYLDKLSIKDRILKLHDKVVNRATPKRVLNYLDKLSIKDGILKLHVASAKPNSIGDESYFYIGDDESRDYKIYKHLKAKPSIEAAWQIYLLHYASTVMPVFWHGGYIVRKYVFDEASLNNYTPLECYDISGLSRANLLLPEVTLTPDGRSANVFCTYWNNWEGLVRDHIQITFLKNGKVELTKIEPLCLFKYNCGRCF